MDDSSDEEPERPPGASATSPPAKEGLEDRRSAEQAEQLEVSRPRNAYEFGQVLNTISARNDLEACAHLLAITAPKDLPVLLSNKLEGDMFLLIVQSLKSHLVAKDPSLVYEHLLYLSRAERFKVSGEAPGRSLLFLGSAAFKVLLMLTGTLALFQMMLTLISKGQKEQMGQLLDDLSDTRANRFTAEDVQALRRQYEL